MAPRRARQRASDAGHRAAPNSDNPVGAVVATATATTRRWLAARQRTDSVSLAWSCGFVLKGPSLLEPFRAPWSIGDSVDVIPPTSLHCTNACDSLTRTQGLRIHPLCCLPTSRVVTLSFPVLFCSLRAKNRFIFFGIRSRSLEELAHGKTDSS